MRRFLYEVEVKVVDDIIHLLQPRRHLDIPFGECFDAKRYHILGLRSRVLDHLSIAAGQVSKDTDYFRNVMGVSAESGEAIRHFHARLDESKIRSYWLIPRDDLDSQFTDLVLQHSKLLGPAVDPVSQISPLHIRVDSGRDRVLRKFSHIEDHVS